MINIHRCRIRARVPRRLLISPNFANKEILYTNMMVQCCLPGLGGSSDLLSSDTNLIQILSNELAYFPSSSVLQPLLYINVRSDQPRVLWCFYVNLCTVAEGWRRRNVFHMKFPRHVKRLSLEEWDFHVTFYSI